VAPYPALLKVDEHAGRVLLVGADAQGRGWLWLFDARSGRPVRTVPLPVAGAVGLVAWAGQAFLLDADAPHPGIDVVDERTGAAHRRIALAGTPTFLALDDQTGQLVVASADASDPTAGRVSLFDAARGTLRGSRPVAAPLLSAVPTGRAGCVAVAGGPTLVASPSPWWQSWLPRSLSRWVPRRALQASVVRIVLGTVALVDVAMMAPRLQHSAPDGRLAMPHLSLETERSLHKEGEVFQNGRS
jgi:hypothetical protein